MPRSNHGLWNWLGCSTLLAVGCAHTSQQPAGFTAPPPGYAGVPVVPVPGPGCNACGPSTNPAVTAPRYSPPLAVTPLVMSLVPPGGIVLGSPIHAHTPPAVTQAAFQPPPPDAHLGTPIVEEGPSIPVPPSEPPTLPLITKK